MSSTDLVISKRRRVQPPDQLAISHTVRDCPFYNARFVVTLLNRPALIAEFYQSVDRLHVQEQSLKVRMINFDGHPAVGLEALSLIPAGGIVFGADLQIYLPSSAPTLFHVNSTFIVPDLELYPAVGLFSMRDLSRDEDETIFPYAQFAQPSLPGDRYAFEIRSGQNIGIPNCIRVMYEVRSIIPGERTGHCFLVATRPVPAGDFLVYPGGDHYENLNKLLCSNWFMLSVEAKYAYMQEHMHPIDVGRYLSDCRAHDAEADGDASWFEFDLVLLIATRGGTGVSNGNLINV